MDLGDLSLSFPAIRPLIGVPALLGLWVLLHSPLLLWVPLPWRRILWLEHLVKMLQETFRRHHPEALLEKRTSQTLCPCDTLCPTLLYLLDIKVINTCGPSPNTKVADPVGPLVRPHNSNNSSITFSSNNNMGSINHLLRCMWSLTVNMEGRPLLLFQTSLMTSLTQNLWIQYLRCQELIVNPPWLGAPQDLCP